MFSIIHLYLWNNYREFNNWFINEFLIISQCEIKIFFCSPLPVYSCPHCPSLHQWQLVHLVKLNDQEMHMLIPFELHFNTSCLLKLFQHMAWSKWCKVEIQGSKRVKVCSFHHDCHGVKVLNDRCVLWMKTSWKGMPVLQYFSLQ